MIFYFHKRCSICLIIQVNNHCNNKSFLCIICPLIHDISVLIIFALFQDSYQEHVCQCSNLRWKSHCNVLQVLHSESFDKLCACFMYAKTESCILILLTPDSIKLGQVTPNIQQCDWYQNQPHTFSSYFNQRLRISITTLPFYSKARLVYIQNFPGVKIFNHIDSEKHRGLIYLNSRILLLQ